MKSYKILVTKISLIVVVLLAPSCDDILNDPQELIRVESGIDYTNTAERDELIKGAYFKLYHLQWETFPLISVRGDDVNAKGDQADLINTDDFKYELSTLWMYNSVWLNLYSDIIDWFSIIEEIRKFNEFADDPGKGEQYIAEIKVMQAYELFLLARVWGDILIPESSETNLLYEAPVVPFDQVMQYVSDQIDDVLPLLSNSAPNERSFVPGGITVHTALAVKAMANLELKNWQGVADATSEIINSGKFQLFPDYYELFKTSGKLADEILLELQYSDFGGSSGGIRYTHQFFGPNNWTPFVDGIGTGWGFWEPTLKYITFMLDRGETDRLETSVIFTDQGIDSLEERGYTSLPEFVSNTTRDGDIFGNTNGNANPRSIFMSGKHYLPTIQMVAGQTTYGSNKNFICIRYSEILLMHAEALVNGASGGGMTADQAVNAVRTRAGLNTLSGVTIDDILDEKFAEFGMEWGIRFYDLVRHNKTSELDGYTDEDRFLPYPPAQKDLLLQLED